MRTLALVAALLAAGPAASETMIARSGGDSVRLMTAPCTLPNIPPHLLERFRVAAAVVDGVPYRACWAPLGDAVLLHYEDGDGALLPLALFRREPGA